MECKLERTSSGSYSDVKKSVPLIVRKETRMALLDHGNNFAGFDTSPITTFKDRDNQAIVTLLIKEVLGCNPTFSAVDIRAAAYTYYKSLCQEQSLKRKGTHEQRKKHRRRRERVVRRLAERESEFKRMSYAESDRAKWKKVLVTGLISSDDSEDQQDGKSVLIVRELPWRSVKMTKFYEKLDAAHKARKSEQAVRRTKARSRDHKCFLFYGILNQDYFCNYIPPASPESYLKEVVYFLNLITYNSDVVIVGDFNTPDIN